ncbi:MAG: putative sulfate exporter family transporter, partial [Proteobacteria bacterium]
MKKTTLASAALFLGAAFCLTPWASSALALVLGIAIAVLLENPYQAFTKKLTPKLLSYSVIGLGAGMNLAVIAAVGIRGVGYTVVGIAAAFALGTLLGRLGRVRPNTSILITVGTAICGGSAIAAVAPVIRADDDEVSVALGIVFLLNAAALLIFPPIGHQLNLSESQFGLWAALAIHDTSSVVGASLRYGAHALEVGTTVKLARALWIIPVALSLGIWRARQSPNTPGEPKPAPKRPWFILGFLAMAALVTWLPALRPAGHVVEALAKQVLVLTLFLIGTNLSRQSLRRVGPRPFAQGALLWLVMAAGTLG